jgi:hypothetical protein
MVAAFKKARDLNPNIELIRDTTPEIRRPSTRVPRMLQPGARCRRARSF